MKMNIRVGLTLLLSLVILLSLLAGCGEKPQETTPSTNPTQSEPAETTKPTEPTEPKVDPDAYILFWNVDRAEFEGKDRTAGTDGVIRVRFAVDGKIGEYKVASADVAKAIDANDLMTVKTDKNGVITEITPYETAVPSVAAKEYFVDKVNGKDVILNSTETLDGTALTITTAPSTRIVDVSGESDPIGSAATLRKGDKIIAIANTKGTITNVFILSRVDLSKTQLCPHCNEEVKFTAWESTTGLPISSSGHFYLLDNVQNSEQMSMQANVEVILDLNGKTVDGANGKRVYSIHNEGAKLSIFDSSEAKTGKLASHGEISAYGCVVWLRYGEFNLYSGTLDASDSVNLAYAIVHVSGGTQFYMHGGTLTGGTTQVSFNETSGAQVGGNGGNVYVIGLFRMTGGEILNGAAYSKVVGEEKIGGMGGNVYVSKSGTFEWVAGTITGGVADNGEADIHLHDEATFTRPE